MDLKFVLGLRLTSCQQLLRDLIANAKTRPDRDSPTVQITVGTHTIVGIPVKIENSDGEEQLALYHPEGGWMNLEALTIIPLRSVDSVKLLHMRAFFEVISGQEPVAGADAGTSREEIDRLLAIIPRNTKIEWDGCEDNALARAYFHTLVKSLTPVFSELAQNRIGENALMGVLTVILRWRDDASLSTRLNKGVLKITVGPQASPREIRARLKENVSLVLLGI